LLAIKYSIWDIIFPSWKGENIEKSGIFSGNYIFFSSSPLLSFRANFYLCSTPTPPLQEIMSSVRKECEKHLTKEQIKNIARKMSFFGKIYENHEIFPLLNFSLLKSFWPKQSSPN